MVHWMEQAKQKVLGYYHNSSTIIVPVGLPYHTSSCSLQGSQLGETESSFSLFPACTLPPNTIHASQ